MLQKNKHIDDSWKQIPNDNVWVGRYYRWHVYTVAEAIAAHRETHHPTMYGRPNAPLNVQIELNMQGEKITRFIDNFHRTAMIQHKFDHGEDRQILVLSKGEVKKGGFLMVFILFFLIYILKDNLKLAQEAGAALVGGPDLIKNIQSGDVKLSDYQFVIAHPNIMPDMVAIRGLLKRKFPNPKNGTLGMNLAEMVKQYLNGIQYSATKDEYQQNYGIIKTCIGYLDMDAKHLEENLCALLQDVNKVRPRREGTFITRVLLQSPPSRETLKIDSFVYVTEHNVKNTKAAVEEAEDEDDGEEEDVNKVAATN